MSTTAETRALFEAGSFEDLSDYEAEHILIEDELSVDHGAPETVETTHRVKNHQTGRSTEITLYAEGYVRFREGADSKLISDYVVDLRFLDPRFCSRFLLARGWLALLAVSGITLAAALLVLPMTEFAAYRIHAAAGAGILCLVGLHRFLKKTGRATAFMTITGRAPVIRIVANIGCIGDTRKAARALKSAIRRYRKNAKPPGQQMLREEMKIHYRLAEDGAISQETCSRSTARILTHFD